MIALLVCIIVTQTGISNDFIGDFHFENKNKKQTNQKKKPNSRL